MTNTTPSRANPGAMRPGFVRAVALACLLLPFTTAGVSAFELALPSNARETTRNDTAPDTHMLATAGFADDTLPALTVEGAVSRAAWRVDVQGITTLQLLAPLRDQLAAEGFDILYECEAATCGGFDFRYRLEVFPAPHMHVDLFDYRYLAAASGAGSDAAEHISILASRSSSSGFLQITTVTPPGKSAPVTRATGSSVRTPSIPTTTTDPGIDLPLADQLEMRGHAILSDLTFQTGSSDLGAGDFNSLADLAAFLGADPNRRVALVGHTDAVGALNGNIALSKRRAASVLERLVSAHGVPRAQLAAEGMGYLSPVTTNLTLEGREANRRVEAVLLNTE